MLGESLSPFERKLRNNPFQHFYPEQELTPMDIAALFIKDYTEYNALTSYTHSLVFGSRGSGKTILFKFLEPACQAVKYGSLGEFLSQPDSFIGIYMNYNRGDCTKREFYQLLQDKDIPTTLSQKIIIHYFIMDICDSVLGTFLEQLQEKIDPDKERRAVDRIVSALDRKGIHRDIPENERNLETLREIIKDEMDKVLSSIQVYEESYGIPGSRLIYSGNFTDPSCQERSFLYIFLNELRHVLGTDNIPFFLLFDEVTQIEELELLVKFHQQIINTFISQRKQNLVCLKVSACPESYSTDVDINGRKIDEIHDYIVITLDSLYTNNKRDYHHRIRDIANKRLEIANWEVKDIEKLLPENPTEVHKMEEAIRYTSEEYDRLPGDKKIESKRNYINKYARARFLQEEFQKKTEYGYTGFDNLVHFSSGIARAFLDVCYHMIIKYEAKYPEANTRDIEFVPFEIQKETVNLYSNSFIDTELLDPISKRSPESEERKLLEQLFNLIEALGQAFKIRLDNKNSRYPRIISVSIKETLRDPMLERVLQRGLRECFFHKKWYRSKSGYEMLQCFILNRRLCPRYKLDLSGFQGRIELPQEDLLLALKDPQKFISRFRAREKTAEMEEEAQQLLLLDM